MVAVSWIGLIGMVSDVGIGKSGKRRSASLRLAVAGHPARRLGGGSDSALLLQIMFYHRVFAPLRDPIIDQLGTRPATT